MHFQKLRVLLFFIIFYFFFLWHFSLQGGYSVNAVSHSRVTKNF